MMLLSVNDKIAFPGDQPRKKPFHGVDPLLQAFDNREARSMSLFIPPWYLPVSPE